MVYITYYSSLNDFGTSGSKNMNIQNVDAPPATFSTRFDTALAKKSINTTSPYFILYKLFMYTIHKIITLKNYL